MGLNNQMFRSMFYTGLAALVMACGSDEKIAPSAAVSAPIASPKTADAMLPVSYNDVMVALVNEAADPIWRAAWKTPETDQDWRQLERRATQLKLAGILLSRPGNGPIDQQWSVRPEWNKWATQLMLAGNAAISAVESRSLEDVNRAGDMIVEVCEGCHIDFKPSLPTGGKYGELSTPPSAEK
ncbi:MAG: hypothetical protein V7459_13050 [Oceanicoccus sp.]